MTRSGRPVTESEPIEETVHSRRILLPGPGRRLTHPKRNGAEADPAPAPKELGADSERELHPDEGPPGIDPPFAHAEERRSERL